MSKKYYPLILIAFFLIGFGFGFFFHQSSEMIEIPLERHLVTGSLFGTLSLLLSAMVFSGLNLIHREAK